MKVRNFVCKRLKQIIKKVVFGTYNFFRLLSFWIDTRNLFYVFLTPNHNNIGDQTILYAEKLFIKQYFPKYRMVAFTSNDMQWGGLAVRFAPLQGNIVTVQGGGFLGTIWVGSEEWFRKVVSMFKEYPVKVFPQTIYFENNKWGKEEIEKSRVIYGQCPSLMITAREEISYKFVKEHFSKTKCILVPDIVLSLPKITAFKKQKRSGALFCLRNDIEKTSSCNTKIAAYFADKMTFKYTDMISSKRIFFWNRKKVILQKLYEFSKSEIVITDRLHGMVFAAMSETPCVVIKSKSHKVKGVYNWLKNMEFIKMIDTIEEFDDAVNSVLSVKDIRYDTKNLTEYFDKLAEEFLVNE